MTRALLTAAMMAAMVTGAVAAEQDQTAYICGSDITAVVDMTAETATLHHAIGEPVVLPARYAQGRSWFFQTEPQEEECTRFCAEMSFEDAGRLFITFDGEQIECEASQ